MFDILIYLFENFTSTDCELFVDEQELATKLLDVGFNRGEIIKALDWISDLMDLQDSNYLITDFKYNSFRIYSFSEQQKLDSDCRGFLEFLVQNRLLTPELREIVIDRALSLDTEIDLDDLKWVTLIVIFNFADDEDAYEQLGDLMFNSPGMLDS